MDEGINVRFSNSRITNQNNLLRVNQLAFSPRRSCMHPRTQTLNKKSKELLRSPMAAVVEGKCADVTDCLCLFYSLRARTRRLTCLGSDLSSSPVVITGTSTGWRLHRHVASRREPSLIELSLGRSCVPPWSWLLVRVNKVLRETTHAPRAINLRPQYSEFLFFWSSPTPQCFFAKPSCLSRAT